MAGQKGAGEEGRKEGRKTVVDGRKQGRTVVVRGEPHSPNDDDEQTHPCIQVWHFLVFICSPRYI